jgi:LuxR family maltose regulon positive regulatory protein
MRDRAAEAHRRSGPGFDLTAAKLRRPSVRPRAIRRSSLIERLAQESSPPIVSVVAPAGYGKTTVLSQWAEGNAQAFAWVQVDERDNDPKVLLTYVAAALDAVQPVGERVFDALASPASSVPGSVVPRLCSAFVSMTVPVVLVLDDVHLLRNSECRSALSVLADHVPARGRLVFAGRDEPPVRVARLRAEGRIVEIGPAELSLTRNEAAALLHAAELTLDKQDVADLHRRTEGWAVGLYLAALYLREGGSLPHAVASFGGSDRFVSEYVESEFLERISRRQRAFLTQTAALERICGPLCDTVLDLPGSAATLAELARSNLLLVPLDHRGEWYRYHHLFRDMLLAELERQEPGLILVLRRRAADWCQQKGLPEEALEYSIAAGDVGTAARLIGSVVVPTYRQGRITTIQRWFRWLDAQSATETHPMAAVLASMFSALTGQASEAERLTDAVDRWQYQDGALPADPSAEAWAALLRAFLCRQGITQMRADADEAVRRFAAESFVTPAPALVQGVARVLSGDLDGGDASLQNALSVDAGAPEDFAIALSERALVAIARNDWAQAAVLAGQADAVLRRAGIEEGMVTPLVCAVQARSHMCR